MKLIHLVLGILLLVSLAIGQTDQPPSLTGFQQFYGAITNLPTTGGPFTLRAQRADGTALTTLITSGQYGYDPTFKVYGSSGQISFFVVNAQNVATAVGTPTSYASGEVTNLNFAYSGSQTGTGSNSGTFDFSLSSGGDKSVVPGAAVISTVSTTLISGTASAVTFSLSPLPAGVTAVFSPLSCTPVSPASPTSPACTTQLTLTTTAATTLGTYQLTITATSGSVTKTAAFTLTVSAAPVIPITAFDFSFSAPESLIVNNGSSTTATISTALVSGVTQPVNFSLSGYPTGVNVTFSPRSCSPPCSTTITILANGSTPAGTSALTMNATNGTLVRQKTVSLAVNPFFDISLSTTGTLSLNRSGSVATMLTATLLGGAPQPVVFNVTDLPLGVTATLSQPTCTPTCSTTITIAASSSAPIGTFSPEVIARGGGITRSTSFGVRISTPSSPSAGSAFCLEKWDCSEYRPCQNNQQTRVCQRTDDCDQRKANNANLQITEIPKPDEVLICQSASPALTRVCTPYGSRCIGSNMQQCSFDGMQWTDLQRCPNGCDSTQTQCAEAAAKEPTQKPAGIASWIYYLSGSLILIIGLVIVILSILGHKKYAPAKEYIAESREKGYSDSQIRDRLVNEGWDEGRIRKLMR